MANSGQIINDIKSFQMIILKVKIMAVFRFQVTNCSELEVREKLEISNYEISILNLNTDGGCRNAFHL